MSEEPFYLDFLVRDYECDMQGVVNNAVYQNYLEHARHEYLKGLGIDFCALARRGINLVVVRAELDYKRSLQSGDRFRVVIRLERVSPLRFAFLQEVRSVPEAKVILKAKIIGTVLSSEGRPKVPKEISRVLDRHETDHLQKAVLRKR